MRGHSAGQTLRRDVMPKQAPVIAARYQHLAIRPKYATGSETGVCRFKRRHGFRLEMNLKDPPIHARRVEHRAIHVAGQPQHSGLERNSGRLLELHARISEIASARSSTRWKVGKLGRSYSA